MGKFVDLTGQKFNRLTVLHRIDDPKHKGATWLCKCDCGKETTAITNELVHGVKKSCGCYRNDWVQSKYSDIVGKRFGRLLVLNETKKVGKRIFFKCKCDCGNIKFMRKDALTTSHVQSCGCLWDEVKDSPERGFKHGLSKDRAYRLWGKIKARCYNESCAEYRNYGGRGIKMCDEWVHDPKAFIDWCYANGYDNKAPKGECTIDRINVDGDYSPYNCRFISNLEQQNNRRDTPKFEYNGEKHTATEWSRILNIPAPTMIAHLHNGKTVDYFINGGYKPRPQMRRQKEEQKQKGA